MIRRFGFLLIVTVGIPAFSVTYQQDIKPLLNRSCVECHDSLSHDPDLTDFPFPTEKSLSQEQLVDRILKRVNGQSMPPGNRPRLSQSDINKIQQWKNEGLPK